MHELGVVLEMIKTVERFAGGNDVGQIETLVLQVGEMSSVVPKYIEDCFTAATEGTILEGAALVIERMPANARCRICAGEFNVPAHRGICPDCGSKEIELLGGRECLIKEIVVVDK